MSWKKQEPKVHRRHEMYKYLCSCFILTCLILHGPAAQTQTALNIACHFDGDNVEVNVSSSKLGNSVELNIDSTYFDQRSIPISGSSQDSLLLRMKADNFHPWPIGTRPHQSEGPYMSFLITALSPFESILEYMAKWAGGHPLDEPMEWTENPGPYGLRLFSGLTPGSPVLDNYYKENPFFSRNRNNEIVDIITCRAPSNRPYRNCDHLVKGDFFDVRVSYSRDFLSDWRRISEMSAEFLNCIMKQEG